MKRRGLEPMHDEHINVTPLIDVIMCLIIFFLLCGKMAADESKKEVRIPVADNGQELSEQRDRLLINLLPAEGGTSAANPDGAPDMWIRGRKVSQSELNLVLRDAKKEVPELKVILRADQDVTYNWISPILVACVQENIRTVNFATKTK